MRIIVIIVKVWLVMLVIASCDNNKELFEKPCQELVEIDSLMWKYPDSAFVVLQEFIVSPKVDSLNEFDGHFCQLLISELLYKNDYEQSNREGLFRALGYFDSIDNAFLAARTHYIYGVGYYEKNDVVNACEEYLKTLKVMDEHYGEKDLVGHKAQFLAYTYNRLGELFSNQFMMESAITCYKYALKYCIIEPTSSLGIPNTLYQIGKLYDMLDEIEKAKQYYTLALKNMTVTDNMLYRDIVASRVLLDYKTGISADLSIDKLQFVLLEADTERERLNRYLTIGGIFFSEGVYDSSLFYLEPVFKNLEMGLPVQAANYLCVVYDKQGNRTQSDSLMRFLSNRKNLDGENKALVSKLENMFEAYRSQIQVKQVEKEREVFLKRVAGITIPFVVIVLVTVYALILRDKRQLKKQQEEAEERLVALGKDLSLQSKAVELQRESFLKETVCRGISDRVRNIHITAREGSKYNVKLTEEDIVALKEAVMRHYQNFDVFLLSKNPKLSKDDFLLCYLYLLGLDERQIAVLMCKTYSAIKKRANVLKSTLAIEGNLSEYILNYSTY